MYDRLLIVLQRSLLEIQKVAESLVVYLDVGNAEEIGTIRLLGIRQHPRGQHPRGTDVEGHTALIASKTPSTAQGMIPSSDGVPVYTFDQPVT